MAQNGEGETRLVDPGAQLDLTTSSYAWISSKIQEVINYVLMSCYTSQCCYMAQCFVHIQAGSLWDMRPLWCILPCLARLHRCGWTCTMAPMKPVDPMRGACTLQMPMLLLDSEAAGNTRKLSKVCLLLDLRQSSQMCSASMCLRSRDWRCLSTAGPGWRGRFKNWVLCPRLIESSRHLSSHQG